MDLFRNQNNFMCYITVTVRYNRQRHPIANGQTLWCVSQISMNAQTTNISFQIPPLHAIHKLHDNTREVCLNQTDTSSTELERVSYTQKVDHITLKGYSSDGKVHICHFQVYIGTFPKILFNYYRPKIDFH